ncbi:MAG: hypothetical protein ABIH23_19200 [bacterium]
MKKIFFIFLFLLIGPVVWGQSIADEPAALTTQRPVLIEAFTATWCTFCYGPGMALDIIQKNYPRSEVIVVVYHKDDPYSIPFTKTRDKYYGVLGYPTAWFNGIIEETGGARYQDGGVGISNVYNIFAGWIQEEHARIASAVPFQLRLEGEIGLTNTEMKLTISSATGYPGSVNAIVLVAEDRVLVPPDQIQFNANKQAVFGAVARAHLGTEPVTLNSPGSLEINISYADSIPHLFQENLRPVVFLQDDTTGEILGAVGEFSEPEPSATSDWWLY